MKHIKKFFMPRPIVLSSGKIVQPKLSPMVYILPILGVAIYYSAELTRFKFWTLIERGGQFFVIIGRMIPPNPAYFERAWMPLLITILMSVFGTIIGAAFSLPAAYVSSENMVKNKYAKLAFRSIFSILRTIPLLILAIIFRNIFGLGAFAGTMAVGVFTFTIMTKMFYELIDTADMGPFEAIESSGANRVQSFWSGIMPQLWGQYIALILYNFEMNIRNAAILGYVGAGGIGILLNERLAWRAYADVGIILIALMVTVYGIESLSRHIRKRLL